MDGFIHFFRDTLSGPLYIVYVIICIILIFACIGYLAEKSINKKKENEKYQEVSNTPSSNGSTISVSAPSVENVETTNSPEPQVVDVRSTQPVQEVVSPIPSSVNTSSLPSSSPIQEVVTPTPVEISPVSIPEVNVSTQPSETTPSIGSTNNQENQTSQVAPKVTGDTIVMPKVDSTIVIPKVK